MADDLVVGEGTMDVTVIIRMDGGVLRVHFRDAGTDVVQLAVVPESLPAADAMPARARMGFPPHGGIRIGHLGPGRYRLYAWYNPHQIRGLFPVTNPRFLRQYRSQSVSVVLGANSELDVDVPLARRIE
jgi:hypothetical protein